MNASDYTGLTRIQQQTLMIAAIVRDSMENFHVQHLNDNQMAELNPIVRQAIFDGLTLLNDPDTSQAARYAAFLLEGNRIPDYWEVPVTPSEWVPGQQTTGLKRRL